MYMMPLWAVAQAEVRTAVSMAPLDHVLLLGSNTIVVLTGPVNGGVYCYILPVLRSRFMLMRLRDGKLCGFGPYCCKKFKND
jgi:hypothetical protein